MSRRLKGLWMNDRFSDSDGNSIKREEPDTKIEVVVIKRPLPVELHLIVWLELIGFCLFSVIQSMSAAARGYYIPFCPPHIAIYLLFFLLMSGYTIYAFYKRKRDAVISALMFNVMVIMDTALGYITGYDHCVGVWRVAVAVLCILVLLISSKTRAVFPVKEWGVGALGSIVFGGYCLTFLLVIVFLL